MRHQTCQRSTQVTAGQPEDAANNRFGTGFTQWQLSKAPVIALPDDKILHFFPQK
jgi:hypothetical protein